MSVTAVADRREKIFQDLLPQISAVPGVLEHIEDGYGRVPFAVVSGSTRDSVTASLTSLGLLDRFDVMVCAGDYAEAKPSPDAFLLAAQLLDIAPESCVVFEDTDLGVQAAGQPDGRTAGRPDSRVSAARRGQHRSASARCSARCRWAGGRVSWGGREAPPVPGRAGRRPTAAGSPCRRRLCAGP